MQYRSGGAIQQFNVLTAQQLGIDSYMQKEINLLPTVGNNNAVGDGLNTTGYSFNARDNEFRDNVTGRLDYYLNAANTFSVIYKWSRDIVDRPDQGSFFTVTPPVFNHVNTKSFTGSYRWSPTGAFTNEVRGGLVRIPVTFETRQADPSIIVTNASTLFTSPINEVRPSYRSTDTDSIQDNANWVHGKHSVSFGFQATRISNPLSDYTQTIAQYTLGISTKSNYGFNAGSIPGASSTDISTANSLLSSLAGLVSGASQKFNPTSKTSGFVPGAPLSQVFSLNNYAPYISDSWKARRNLTITLGLRWEYFSPVGINDGLLVQPQVPNGNVVQALLGNSTLNFSASQLSKKDLNNFFPNIGFAWDIFGDGKTSFRGGYSIAGAIDNNWNDAYNVGNANNGLTSTRSLGNLTAFASQAPTIPTPPFSLPTTAAAQFALSPSSPPVEGLVDPNLATPYVQQWNAGIQRDYKGTVIEVRYVGNHATKMLRQLDLNQINIFQSLGGASYVTDFKNARNNGFLALAATGTFNPSYNGKIAGSQPLPFFGQLASGGLLTNSTVAGYIRGGEAATLAQVYQTNGFLPQGFSFFPNPYLLYSSVLTNYSNSTYNALQVEARKRARNGLQIQANYTFSKVLSDAELTRGLEALLDNGNPGIEKSRAPFDVTHSFKVNHDYPLPFGPGRKFLANNRVLGRVVGGWSLTGFLHIDSGAPISILSSIGTLNRAARSTANTVDPVVSADQVGSAVGLFMTGNGPYILNPANIGSDGRGIAPDGAAPFSGQLVAKPQPGSLGALQRRQFDGPVYWNYNFGVIKETKITERQTLQFKADFFNLFNHPTFFAGDQTVTSASFGRLTSMLASGEGITVRLMRFGLTYKF